MQQAFNQGNFRDAFEGFRRLALDPQDNPGRVAGDLHKAVECLSRLGRLDETDALLEDAIKVHPQNWRLLAGAAREYQETQHFGFLVAGKFYRGYHRGGGNWVTAGERDRVRALQLMVQAMPLALEGRRTMPRWRPICSRWPTCCLTIATAGNPGGCRRSAI